MGKYLLISFFMFSFLASGLAQEQNSYIQLSGMIKNENNDPIPFVHVMVKENERSTVSDYNGLYTIVVESGDTVFFSSIGYKKHKLAISKNLSNRHIIREVEMKTDTIMLKAVMIFPWKTYAEFRNAVINTEMPVDKAMEAAQLNIALIQTQILLNNTSTPNANFRNVMMQQFEKNRTYGQSPYYGILDVMAWSKFIKALKNGEFKKKK